MFNCLIHSKFIGNIRPINRVKKGVEDVVIFWPLEFCPSPHSYVVTATTTAFQTLQTC